MARLRVKCGKTHRRCDKSEDAGTEYDDGKRNIQEEDADKGDCGQCDHHSVLERAFADANQRLDHDGENRGFQAEEQRDDDGDVAPGCIDIAQRHDGDDAGNDKKPAGNDAAEGAVHQPADIGRELLRLRTRQQHAVVERVQEALLRYPALLFDQDAVHDRDLSRGTAEAQRRDAQPSPQRLVQRDTVLRLPSLGDRQLSQGLPRCASEFSWRIGAPSLIGVSSGSTRRGR